MTANERGNVIRPVVLFALGAGFGLIVGFWLVVTVQEAVLFFLGLGACAIVGGLLSARYGVRYWEKQRHLRWFVP